MSQFLLDTQIQEKAADIQVLSFLPKAEPWTPVQDLHSVLLQFSICTLLRRRKHFLMFCLGRVSFPAGWKESLFPLMKTHPFLLFYGFSFQRLSFHFMNGKSLLLDSLTFHQLHVCYMIQFSPQISSLKANRISLYPLPWESLFLLVCPHQITLSIIFYEHK